jgi:hypothetical protein
MNKSETTNVMFFENGNTAAFSDKKPNNDLQVSWIALYCDFLKLKGYEPTKIKFVLPNGKNARIFKTKDGQYNWEIG